MIFAKTLVKSKYFVKIDNLGFFVCQIKGLVVKEVMVWTSKRERERESEIKTFVMNI